MSSCDILICFDDVLYKLYHLQLSFKHLEMCHEQPECELLLLFCFVPHSIVLLWPSEWEVIGKLFIVDQPISINCVKQTTPTGPTTKYTTQPGKRTVFKFFFSFTEQLLIHLLHDDIRNKPCMLWEKKNLAATEA